ncbi:hypothetical protein GBA52_019680 [Prunus armeniaca]|nr:hypothetical protein GBA52_019680 [Prunus armeniaca]
MRMMKITLLKSWRIMMMKMIILLKFLGIINPAQKQGRSLVHCHVLCLARKPDKVLILHPKYHHLHLRGLLKLPTSSSQTIPSESQWAHPLCRFSKLLIKLEEQTAKLLVRKKLWCVSLIAHSVNTFPFSVGWAAFARENCLRAGDVCIFELVDKNDISLKVHMFRC